MKMQIDILKKGSYGFNLKGSKALKLMMDNETPQIDLLVRESIQNSADAARKDLKLKKCMIQFLLMNFDSDSLASKLQVAGEVLKDRFGSSRKKCLVITDRLTTGLLGSHDEDHNSPNNLYKLVYSFLESGKDNDYSGGSWGIGKSVYYRFGIGMVFYYSRTFENGRYCQKLAGAIIENETSPTALLKTEEDSSGIAFFGQNATGKKGLRSIPITNDAEIEEFLSVFQLKPFERENTGTRIIIPYFDDEMLIESRNNNEYVAWENDFEKSMIAAIQRWYFPRIDNEEYDGEYISVKVNENHVVLNNFYSTLQRLYMGKIEGAGSINISTSTFKDKIGTFYYKKFTKEELGVETPPDNLPSPYAFFDIDDEREDDSNKAIIFYTRKPGMIITYDDAKTFTNIKTVQGEYLIGVFVLNDDATYHDEKIGNYFKEVEKANHKTWTDIKTSDSIKEITTLKTKPFKAIKNQISKELNAKFGKLLPDEVLTKNSALQKKLGEILLPPEDFGKDKEPTIKRRKRGGKPPLTELKKEKRTEINNNGIVNGKPSYSFQIYIKPGEQYFCKLYVKTSSKKYSFDDWDKLEFVLPCYLRNLSIDGFMLNKINFRQNIKRDYEDKSAPREIIKSDGNKETIFKIVPFETPVSNKVYGFKLMNVNNEDLRITINFSLEPCDETTGFIFVHSFVKIGGDNRAK